MSAPDARAAEPTTDTPAPGGADRLLLERGLRQALWTSVLFAKLLANKELRDELARILIGVKKAQGFEGPA